MNYDQISLFELVNEKKVIKKPCKLIELFAGYGSQNLAMKHLGVNYQHHKICEWATKSIQAYNDLHIQDYSDYSKVLTSDEVVDKLYQYGISADYNSPMTRDQIKRKGEKWQRTTYNNIIATNNLVNIQNVKGKDLEIVDTDKYEYLFFYSFPCQDLSLAGKSKGMSKGSGTRSGMLWEVERILDECKELSLTDSRYGMPTCLIMENVPQVIGKKHIKDFQLWVTKLESLGYSNFVEVLNAKDYGIPQNRERCFMVSILGEYSYNFPKPIKLENRLKDLLENEVDESYFLSDKMIQYIVADNEKCSGNNDKSLINKTIASTINTCEGQRRCDASNYICDELEDDCDLKVLMKEKNKTGVVVKVGNYSPSGHNASSIVDSNGIAPVVMENHGTITAVLLQNDDDMLKKQLCNSLIKNNLVEEYDVVKHSYTQQIMDGNKKCVEKSDGIMITLTTRGDCVGVCVKENNYNLRIRKLTPKECWRLMGVKDEDYEKVAKNQSKSSLYHLAGDSIVSSCLVGIIGSLFDIDYISKIKEISKNVREFKDEN